MPPPIHSTRLRLLRITRAVPVALFDFCCFFSLGSRKFFLGGKSKSKSGKHHKHKSQAATVKSTGVVANNCYDPNKHCGVFIHDEARPCLNTLACRVHSLVQRRQVKGRSGSFDSLLADHSVSILTFTGPCCLTRGFLFSTLNWNPTAVRALVLWINRHPQITTS